MPHVMPDEFPLADRKASDVQGHWLLARLGKRVLRPGGLGLTRKLLRAVHLDGQQVVELAPGLGRTAILVMAHHPSSYTGVDSDPQAAELVKRVVAPHGVVVTADASATGLPDASADVVLGEAMLTMQGGKGKKPIVAEAARILRPGGRYAIHELALRSENVAHKAGEDIRKSLAKSMHVNARPLTIAEWKELLAEAGLHVTHVDTAPLGVLQPRRIFVDEGFIGALKFFRNVLRDKEARQRVMKMATTFRANKRFLFAVGIIAIKPLEPPTT